MSTPKDKKLQIVAFSTNDTTQTPNDIINIFLGQQNHTIIKKSRHSIAFSTNLKNSSKSTTIIICSILNLTREYTGITDVNCYILFINLEKDDSLEKLEGIINYAKDYCELGKKIYVLGMLSGSQEEIRCVNKADITKELDQIQVNYEYKEINLSNAKEVADAIMEVIDYSSKHSINGDSKIDREAAQGKSCAIF
jgi:hypothetical protein